MDINKVKISSVILANTLIEALKDVIEDELDKNERADADHVDLAIELNEILSNYIDKTNQQL